MTENLDALPPWEVEWQVSPKCAKCAKFVPVDSLGATVWSCGDYDEVIDLTDCPRCGIQRVGLAYRAVRRAGATA